MNGRSKSLTRKLLAVGPAMVVAGACSQTPPGDLSPASWPRGELERYYALLEFNPDAHGELAVSDRGVVVGTTGGAAVRAGLEALRQGGSAADAVLTTSLAQISLAAGSWVSYAGLFSMVYFDAATGQVSSLNAGFNTVQGETEPLTIPRLTFTTNQDVAGGDSGEPSGRTALVPGYMAGVAAAHERFGKLPWAEIFSPAIYFADHGFPVSNALGFMIKRREDVLSRLPESKAVFTKEDGSWYGPGDQFTQPAVAATLRRVAAEGAGYMYTGEWAQKLVAAVQRDGGKMAPKDLADYRVIWGEPLHTEYNGNDVSIYGLPAKGGVGTLEALNLYEAAGMAGLGHYQSNPDAFAWFARGGVLWALSYLPEETAAHLVPGLDLSYGNLMKKETAWELVKRFEADPDFLLTAVRTAMAAREAGSPTHSDGVVAVDRWGNMAAIVHSINTVLWGRTGIIVDGVSIPDAAAIQVEAVAAAGPGNRLPDPTSPLVVVKDGRAVLGLSTIGSNLGVDTLKTVTNVLDYGMDMRQAIFVPELFVPGGFVPGTAEVVLIEGEYPPEFIEAVKAKGVEVQVIPPRYRGNSNGGSFVVGIRRNPATGTYEGSTTTKSGGMALAVAQ